MKIWSWRQAIQKSKLGPTTKLVLFNLSVHMNDEGGGCFPSTKRQAEDTGLSERSVCTHLSIAEDAGFIVRTRHGFGGQGWARNEYVAAYPEGTELASAAHKKALNVVPEGTEPDDIKALKEVQSNSSYNSSVNSERPNGAPAPACKKKSENKIPIPEDYLDAPEAFEVMRGGLRLTEGWFLCEPWGRWAEETLGLSQEKILAEAEKFKRYFLSPDCKKPTKKDWKTTWKNWIQR